MVLFLFPGVQILVKLLQQICDWGFLWLSACVASNIKFWQCFICEMLPSLYLMLCRLSSFPFCAVLFIFLWSISCGLDFFLTIFSLGGATPLPFVSLFYRKLLFFPYFFFCQVIDALWVFFVFFLHEDCSPLCRALLAVQHHLFASVAAGAVSSNKCSEALWFFLINPRGSGGDGAAS